MNTPGRPYPTSEDAARQGREAVSIATAGRYTSPSGQIIELGESVRNAMAGTIEYPPDAEVPVVTPSASKRGAVSVVNGTSLESAVEMARRGLVPLVLNFASAKNPGGGFLGGAIAQEESLARSSALFACLDGRRMYSFHRRNRDAAYTSWMIYSPGVPVFRSDRSGALLEEPYACAFLTAPAPNAKVVLEREPGRRAEVERAMSERITRALRICVKHGHRHLVLGAWGCGVFGNDPSYVAAEFRRVSSDEFRDAFDEVVFAVLDTSRERRFIGPFEANFG
ncbi:MAG: TIGR02452 family protein [Deltaproteobacteria bacterium]|nr:TIGR02452 family protein [Deltaproteobacteria bacterium]